MPFGGVGGSGYGHYHGRYGFDSCSHLKPVMNKMVLNIWLLSCRYPPYTESKFKTLMILFKIGDIK